MIVGTLNIRPMGIEDVHGAHVIESLTQQAPWGFEIIRDCVLVNYDCRIIEVVARESTEMVGYSICRHEEEGCHLLNLCVKPLFQGQGIGTFLLQNILDSLIDHGTTRIRLEVRKGNIAAIRLYEKMGFINVGIKNGYYYDSESIEDAIMFERS